MLLRKMLFRLAGAIPAFSDSVRPICLATPDLADYPPCPDMAVVKSKI